MQAQIERNIAKKLQHFLGVGNVVGITILRGNRVGTVIYNVIVIKALVLDCPRDVLGGLGIDGILVFVKSRISFIIAKEGFGYNLRIQFICRNGIRIGLRLPYLNDAIIVGIPQRLELFLGHAQQTLGIFRKNAVARIVGLEETILLVVALNLEIDPILAIVHELAGGRTHGRIAVGPHRGKFRFAPTLGRKEGLGIDRCGSIASIGRGGNCPFATKRIYKSCHKGKHRLRGNGKLDGSIAGRTLLQFPTDFALVVLSELGVEENGNAHAGRQNSARGAFRVDFYRGTLGVKGGFARDGIDRRAELELELPVAP